MEASGPPLRLGLTLSGGASLGAFEAGAAAALVLAVRHLDGQEGQEASIDAIGGASAGALVALASAHALLEGVDPVELLHETWVEGVTLSMLRSGDSRALLSFDALREGLPDVLASVAEEAGRAEPQRRPIALHVQLTGLRGLTYPIRGLRRDSPVTATSYADWGRFELEPEGGIEQLIEPEGRSPLDFALASAASPGGFAPQLLDRRADAENYRSRGIENFPESGRLWYTDGGMLGSQPIGRVIAAARGLHDPDEDATRVQILIDPRSEEGSAAESWSDPDAEPSWQSGASRALAILSEQSLFDDLRRVEKDNSRIEWAVRLAETLAPCLDSDAERGLRDFVSQVEDERGEMRSDEPSRDDERKPPAEETETRALLHRAICEIGGLVGKDRVAIDVISPFLLADEEHPDVGSLLAGEFMGDFGGFLSRELRESDFALGYECTLAWLRDGLPGCGVEDEPARRVVDFVESRRLHDPEQVGSGDTELADLSLADRFQLVRLGFHAVRVLAAGALDVRSRIPDPLGRAISRAREHVPRAGG